MSFIVRTVGAAVVVSLMSIALAGSATPWTENQLQTFSQKKGDGQLPYGGLLSGANGIVYGTTAGGGAYAAGTVFEATPQAGTTVWTENILYSFKGGSDGAVPLSKLIADARGNLYGTTSGGGGACGATGGCGTVFELEVPAAGQTVWTEIVLHAFTGSDGQLPGPLVANPRGTLYGLTSHGGLTGVFGCDDGSGVTGCGVAFALAPPAPGRTLWSQSVIHTFGMNSDDGKNPAGGLIADAHGALYGVTARGGPRGRQRYNSSVGTVFKLSPPNGESGVWAETRLHTFSYSRRWEGAIPNGSLVADARGSLYGVTESEGQSAGGTVFQLSPPAPGATEWTEHVLHSFRWPVVNGDGFNPQGDLLVDARGSLYGITLSGGDTRSCGQDGCGTVYKLTPPASGRTIWSESVLHAFQGVTDGAQPMDGLIKDANGALFGTTFDGGPGVLGTVFELTGRQ